MKPQAARCARRQRGVALLTALLAVVLAAVLLAILLDAVEFAQARTVHSARALQADAYARGMERWALEMLRRDAALDQGRDSRSEAWHVGLPPTAVEGGQVSGRLIDASGCFNVNNLAPAGVVVPWQLERFRRLLGALQLDQNLAEAVADYVDLDAVPLPRGAEDARYAAANPPHRAANRALSHPSELGQVAGLDREALGRLLPHVCTLPAPSAINVNTASVPLLMALDPGIGEALARRLAADGMADWRNLEDFRKALTDAGIMLPDLTGSGVASQYFIAQAQIQLDGVPYMRSALLERGRGPAPDRVVARAYGTW